MSRLASVFAVILPAMLGLGVVQLYIEGHIGVLGITGTVIGVAIAAQVAAALYSERGPRKSRRRRESIK
jgi:hypothetical protein